MKLNDLLEAAGIERWTIHNAVGIPKKFKKVDGWWEKPLEVKKWMTSSELPRSKDEVAREREERRAEREELAAQRAAEKARVAALPTAQQAVDAVENAISMGFPDGDPIDHLIPWMKRHGVDMDFINAAMKKHHGKDYYTYLADMWDDHAADHIHDARQGHHGEDYSDEWFAQPNPWK